MSQSSRTRNYLPAPVPLLCASSSESRTRTLSPSWPWFTASGGGGASLCASTEAARAAFCCWCTLVVLSALECAAAAALEASWGGVRCGSRPSAAGSGATGVPVGPLGLPCCLPVGVLADGAVAEAAGAGEGCAVAVSYMSISWIWETWASM